MSAASDLMLKQKHKSTQQQYSALVYSWCFHIDTEKNSQHNEAHMTESISLPEAIA